MPHRAARPGRVLACGLTTLDVVQTVDHVPAPDEKLVASDLLVAAGGPAANAAVTAALLGVPARLVTRIGGGALAGVVAADLRAHGVEVLDLAPADASPPLSTVLVTRSTGERAVVSVNGTAFAADGRGVGVGDGVGAGVWDGVVVVLLDGHHPDLALACAREARGRGIPVVLDGGSWKPGLRELLPLVDVAVLSADFTMPDGGAGGRGAGGGAGGAGAAGGGGGAGAGAGGVATGTGDRDGLLAAVRSAGPRVVAQSNGSGPLRVVTDAGVRSIPVPSVAVVDTLGAGDVLHGAFVAWLAARWGARGAGVRGAGARDLTHDDDAAGLVWAAGVASASCASAGARGWAGDGVRLASWHRDLRRD